RQYVSASPPAGDGPQGRLLAGRLAACLADWLMRRGDPTASLMSMELLTDLSNQMAGAVERAAKSLVTVKGRARQPATGIAYAPGLVLTANHVLERDEDLTIEAEDGKALAAQLAGRDPASDLALLRVADLQVTPAVMADGPARVGQLALAVGRPSSHG